jgi:hypothetical protein
MSGCETVACIAQAFLRRQASDVVEKNAGSTPCYARYGADDAGGCLAADDSPEI